MYKAYVDDHLIYHPNDEKLKLIAAKVQQEVNSSGTFEYRMYPSHPEYGKEKKLKSIVRVYDDDELIFRGRVLNDDIGLFNDKTVTCEGELSFLVDTIQRPYEFTGTPAELFYQLLDAHNEQVEETKQFQAGYVTVTDPNDYIARSDTLYKNTLESMKEKLLEPCGGYLMVRHVGDDSYLDYLAELDTLNDQTVEFGSNLVDIKKSDKGEEIITAIIPLGAKSEDDDTRLTIASVNNDVDYVYDEDAVEEYGWIFGTVEFDDVTLPSNLKTKGLAALEASIHSVPTIEITAVDLNAIDKNIASFQVGKLTSVKSNPHGINQNYLTTSRTIDLLSPANSKLVLGGTIKGLTDTTSNTAKLVNSVSIAVNKENGTIYAEQIRGVINLINTQLKVQNTAAKRSDVKAMLFEDLDPDSELYGILCAGTQGIQISNERNDNDTDWIYTTAITAAGIIADTIIAGILSDKKGYNTWNLDTGELHTKFMSAVNAVISGTLTSSTFEGGIIEGASICSSGEDENGEFSIVLEDGKLKIYYADGVYVGYVRPVEGTLQIGAGENSYGEAMASMSVSADGSASISAENGVFIGNVKLSDVQQITSNGELGQTTTLSLNGLSNLEITNGIITGWNY